MITATAIIESYRYTPKNGKLALEFDGTIVDETTECEDRVTKQIIVSDTLAVAYSELDDMAIEKMVEWELANSNTGE